MTRLSLADVEVLAHRALLGYGASESNARIVAASLAAAEADGIASHGLLRLPTYCRHLRSGKVDGSAAPTLEASGRSTARVDACDGFAHPAIDLALDWLANTASSEGLAAASITRSYNSGVMGHPVEKLARRGFVALGFSNAPAVIAPWGGTTPLFGTNPIAFAAPTPGEPIVIDQACSVVARGEVMLRRKRGEPIPEGWGFDASGMRTTDPEAVLQGGSMAPAGGHKGATLALMVEILAATVTGALPSRDAGSLTADDGKPAGLGQAFIALSPGHLGTEGYGRRMEALCAAMAAQPDVRLPGARRLATRERARTEGVEIDPKVLAEIEAVRRG